MSHKRLLFRSEAREKVLRDPTKVVRLALENAVSVAGVLLLTEATMTEVPDAKPETASATADMGM